jgi:hypothetical protein
LLRKEVLESTVDLIIARNLSPHGCVFICSLPARNDSGGQISEKLMHANATAILRARGAEVIEIARKQPPSIIDEKQSTNSWVYTFRFISFPAVIESYHCTGNLLRNSMRLP